MDEVIQFLLDHRAILDTLPFPIYCTELESGRFLFANQSLARLVGYSVDELQSKDRDASLLYVYPDERLHWKDALMEHRSDDPLVHEFQFNPRRPADSRKPRLIDVARRFGSCAIGTVVEVTRYWHEWSMKERLLAHTVATYRKILDLDWINVGVHEINDRGEIVWMNSRERQQLQISKDEYGNWLSSKPHVCELSLEGHDGIRTRVQQKIKGSSQLNPGSDRRFRARPHDPPQPPAASLVLPVNLIDHGIDEPDRAKDRTYSGIVTTVRDGRIPSDVTSILSEFGPRNPLLEQLKICTFIKVKRRHARRFNTDILSTCGPNDNLDQLVFTFGNKEFEEELVELSNAGKTEVKVECLADLIGKSEKQLFPHHYSEFSDADREVMSRPPGGSPEGDQRIEKHPARLGSESIDVQVFKIPIGHPDNPQECVGVQGFYWPLTGVKTEDRLNEIREHLKRLYSPPEILNHISVPVYRKDAEGRFIYCNSAFIDDINSLPPKERKGSFPHPCSIHDIIGRTDGDIFTETRASKYKQADDDILASKTSRFMDVERHGSGTVRVIKTPIREIDGSGQGIVVGIQGIYWFLTPQEEAAYSGDVQIDWKLGLLKLRGHAAPYPIDVHSDERWWYLFDYLWTHRNRRVSYAEIARYVYDDEALAKELEQDPPPDSAKGKIQSRKRRLVEAMAKLGLCSADGTDSSFLFWFQSPTGYYQLQSSLGSDE